MTNLNLKKLAGWAGIFFMLSAFISVVFTVISWRVFWMIAVIIGAIAYLVLPKMQD